MASESVRPRQPPEAGDSLARHHQRPAPASFASWGSRSRPSTSTRSARASWWATTPGSASSGWAARPSATAFQMEGGFNDVTLTLCARRRRRGGHHPARPPARALRRPRRDPAVAAALALLPAERDRFAAGIGAHRPHRLPRRRGVPAERRADAPRGLQREQIAALKALGYANSEIGVALRQVEPGGGAQPAPIVGTVAGACHGPRHDRSSTRDFFHFPLLEYRLPAPCVVERRRRGLAAAAVGALGAVAPRGPTCRPPRPCGPSRLRATASAGSSAPASRRWLSQPSAHRAAQHPAPPRPAALSASASRSAAPC